ncbi:MAG: anti-sigma factor antagonist [Bacteroidetes bacterium]|nr:MAG: anti-sigma factor antagonist [Bacteroidota bacterium]
MDFSFKAHNAHTGTFHLKGNLIGETDGINITESFMEQLEQGIRNVILDLSELQHINSSGLGVFITLLTKARKVGGEVMLAGPSDYIQNLLMITKLNTIFHIHGSEAEALSSLST